MNEFLTDFQAARKVSTPLIAVRTPDPAATIAAIAEQNDTATLVRWDIVRGLTAVDEKSMGKLRSMTGNTPAEEFGNPVTALLAGQQLPADGILFLMNAHKLLTELPTVQAIWNLRDLYKQDQRTLVLLAPDFSMPPELVNDVLVLDEPLPTRTELQGIIRETYEGTQQTPPDAETLEKATDAICGLAAFPAEQVCAMSMTQNGMNIPALWKLKRTQVEQTPGLKFDTTTATEIAGVANYVDFMTKLLTGPARPGALVLLDEIGDAMAGVGGDNTGVSQDMHGTVLTFMEDNKVPGVLAYGVPGVGKTYGLGVIANRLGIPFIKFDLGAIKASHVGESETRLRNGLKIAKAISGGRLLFGATTNSTHNLSPQLMSRFRFLFFFDIPTQEGREEAWSIYTAAYQLAEQSRPDDSHWTPREIRNCCETAWALNCSLIEASRFIVPVYLSGAEQIKAMREEANGKYLDADRPGFYTLHHPDSTPQPKKGRRLLVTDTHGGQA